MGNSNWEDSLKEITDAFKDEFSDLSLAHLNWKPSTSTWSIAQNIDHLIVINRSYFPSIKAVKEGNYKVPFLGKFGFIVNFMGQEILKGVQPGKGKKIKTFPIWEPEQDHLPEDILDRFVLHQTALITFIQETKACLPLDTIISSPANKNIVYKLETAFDIIVTHEKRHLVQAKNVKLALEKDQ